MTTNKNGFAYQVWDFFCSLKLTIFLLIGLALTSIIGTIVMQGPSREYLATLSETKIRLYSALGFFDMYHSWWFILLLYLLTLNLICCSIKRLPRVWKTVFEPVLVMDERFEKTLGSNLKEVKLAGKKAELKDKMVAFLKAEFANPTVTEHEGQFHLFAEKARLSRLGVYVVHFSIIIVFIGALLGSFFGYKAYVNIPEGGSIDQVQSRTGKMIDLGFSVRCEKFSVAFYDTGAPKEFKSILTVLEKGKPVPGFINVPTIVNEPLTYKGITFYQSSYGPSDEGALYHLTVRDRKGGAPLQLTARQGERLALPGGAYLSVMEATANVRPFMKEFDGPGAQVEFTPPGGKPQPFVILSDKYESFNAQHGGDLVITFAGLDQKFYTGLQVAKDPGVLVVWLGCFLMVVGIIMAFFMSHKRVWVRVTDGVVTLGGSASKNPAGFEMKFDELLAKLKG